MMNRRRILAAGAACAASRVLPARAQALPYPTRPVRLVVGYAPGGSTDIVARIVTPGLAERLGQSFIVENRPGAGTNIATENVVKAAPDGYTLLMIGVSSTINATLYDKLNFVFLRDIAPVASVVRQTQVVLAHPSVPVATIPELIAYAKANPGKLNMASSGNGSTIHMSGELFKMMTGVDMIHVPYRGGALALTDLVGGQVQVMFDNIPTAMEFVRSGKLRGLAVTGAGRSETLPDLPTVADFLPGYEATSWYGLGAPKGTPNEIIEKLNREVTAALADPAIKAKLAQVAVTTMPLSASAFGAMVAAETDKWAKLIKASGIKPE